MLFAIYCVDGEGKAPVRAANLEAHGTYLASKPIDIVLCGPLRTQDGKTTVGSLFVVEAESVERVEAFSRNDPLYKAGVWSRREVHAFVKRDV